MKVPKFFMVFGKKIKIYRKDLGPSYDGLYFPAEEKIVICSKLEECNVDRTVVHEFLHAVIDRCSLTQVVSYPSEEVLVDMITKCLLENFDLKPKK